MKNQFAKIIGSVLFLSSTWALGQTTNSVSTSVAPSSSLFKASSYELETNPTVGGWWSPSGTGSYGRYYSLQEKLTHKSSQVGLVIGMNFNQQNPLDRETAYDYFDNPSVALVKTWKSGDRNGPTFFDSVQAGISTTPIGNREAAQMNYRGSLAPSVRTTKEIGRTTWVQTLGYSHGFYSSNLTSDGRDNVINLVKMAQVLSYHLSEAFVVTAYGQGFYGVNSDNFAKGWATWCLGAEYSIDKTTVMGFGYGPGANFVNLDASADQLAHGPTSYSGYAELNLSF